MPRVSVKLLFFTPFISPIFATEKTKRKIVYETNERFIECFAVVLAITACAGNSGENKKSNESTKEDNKMEVVALNKVDF